MTSITDIEKLCRICIKNSHSYCWIYEKYIINDSLLFDVINDVCQLDMHVDDGLPEYICYDCHVKISEFKEFKNRSHECRAIFPRLTEKFQKLNVQTEECNGIFSRGMEEDPDGFIYQVNVKTEEMIDYTNLNSWTSVGGIHAEEDNQSCTEIDLIPIKLEYDDPIMTNEIGAVNTLTQEVSAEVEHSSVLNVNRAEIARGTPSLALEPGKRFNNIFNSKHHKMAHSGENPFICDESTFDKNIKYQQKDKMVYRGKKTFVHNNFGKKYTHSSTHTKHMRLHSAEKAFECDECSKCFTQKGELKIHMRVHSREKPFGCLECNKHFTHKGGLKMHMMVHSGEKPFQCHKCNKCFTEKGTLKRHMTVHSGEKSFGCDECSKCFTRKGHLKVHMMVHSGEKPYVCVECNKCFTQKGHLNIHMRVHSGEKPFLCHECNKCFTEKGSLKRHMRLHSGEKPFGCDECNKCFSQKRYLKCHMMVHSREKLFVCVKCNMCFTRKQGLKNHMWVHSGESHSDVMNV